MISLLRTLLTIVVAVALTLAFASVLMLAVLFRVPHTPASVYVRLPRAWCRAILWAAGVSLSVSGRDRVATGGPFVFTSNHVSLFDIPALVMALPQHYFVAKAELFNIPVFGPGIRATGAIPIQRNNSKAAFGAYEEAVERVRAGASVVVFPEGTRGESYDIRSFKKGPFVFAINAGAPVVPCVVYGTIAVLPRNSLRVHPGRVHVQILDPIPTTGMGYDDRDRLASQVHRAMATAVQSTLAMHDSKPMGT